MTAPGQRIVSRLRFLPLLLALASQSAAQPAAYRVGADDVLDIAVFGQPDLTGRFAVAPDGTVQFPLVGQVKAVGQTAQQLQAELARRLSDGYLKSPQVTVTVAEFKSQRVFVVGEVKASGPIPLTGDLTLLEALTRAGSLTETAGPEIVLVGRNPSTRADVGPILPDQPGAGETQRFSVADLQAGRATSNPLLKDGDTVFVPRAEKIFVLGQVRTPGAYTYTARMTVLQAVTLAGGLTELAASGRVKVLRVVNGEHKEIKAKLTDALAPGDTVTVPTRWF